MSTTSSMPERNLASAGAAGMQPPTSDDARLLAARLPEEANAMRSELELRLALRNPALVGQVFGLVKALYDAETARQARIDAKATALLGSIGFTQALLFGFGGVLLTNVGKVEHFEGLRAKTAVCGFALSALAGIVAALCAVLAARVRRYSAVSEPALFDSKTLALADSQDEDAVGVATYQRWVVPQLWEIIVDYRANHEKKARWIRAGQVSYCVAILSVSLIVVLVAVTALRI